MEVFKRYWKEGLIVIIAISACLWVYMSRPKFGYINTGSLIEQYQGYREARNKFELNKASILTKVDSLEKDLIFEIQKYKKDSSKLSLGENRAIRQKLGRLQYEYNENKEVANRRIDEFNNTMLESVLIQVNSYVEKYGKENGYDIIFGTLETGNVLYGKKSIDLTENILKGLNDEYSGK